MSSASIDLADLLDWEEGLPRPRWEAVQARIEAEVSQAEQPAAWVAVERQWLEALGPACDAGYRAVQSDRFLLLITGNDGQIDRFLGFAETCHDLLENQLATVADLRVVGKHVVLAFRNVEDYYRYVAGLCPEGEQGGSAAMHIRLGHPHIAVNAADLAQAQISLAHELTHAALQHLGMPLWVEEGLTQMFEHDAGKRWPRLLGPNSGERQRRYWRKYGLESFWSGDGFFAPTRRQGLCYELAETLMRLLIEDHRPRWFGLSRGRRQCLIQFLQTAKYHDAGQSAAVEHLGFGLENLVTKFLGPGDWGPQSTYEYDMGELGPPASRPREGGLKA